MIRRPSTISCGTSHGGWLRCAHEIAQCAHRFAHQLPHLRVIEIRQTQFDNVRSQRGNSNNGHVLPNKEMLKGKWLADEDWPGRICIRISLLHLVADSRDSRARTSADENPERIYCGRICRQSLWRPLLNKTTRCSERCGPEHCRAHYRSAAILAEPERKRMFGGQTTRQWDPQQRGDHRPRQCRNKAGASL